MAAAAAEAVSTNTVDDADRSRPWSRRPLDAIHRPGKGETQTPKYTDHVPLKLTDYGSHGDKMMVMVMMMTVTRSCYRSNVSSRVSWCRCNKPKSLYATNTTIVILATRKALSVVFIAQAFTSKTLFLATPMTLSSSKNYYSSTMYAKNTYPINDHAK